MTTIRGLDDKLEEHVVVENMLRSLLEKFNPKFLAIEVMNNMKNLILEKLLRTFTSYYMRISNGNPAKKESTCKADKKPKKSMFIIFVNQIRKNPSL